MTETAEFIQVKTAPTVEKTREIIYNELRRDVAEWMTTNEDLVYRPAVELTEEGGEFAARVLVPGVHAKDMEVWVTPERLLIKGKQLMRSIEFPRPINPDRVDAEITDGILSIHAKIAKSANIAIFRPRAA
jgi:HSP20 family molecular chaperone IbpA